MDNEISALHQRINRLIGDAARQSADRSRGVDFDRISDTEWQQLAARNPVRVKDAKGPQKAS
jgi:hypothetical protein